jgi:hypothetical protein
MANGFGTTYGCFCGVGLQRRRGRLFHGFRNGLSLVVGHDDPKQATGKKLPAQQNAFVDV